MAKKPSRGPSSGPPSKEKPSRSRSSGKPNPSGPGEESGLSSIALRAAAQSRYLNYSLSVITSRALPDVRDGLKPVQRRIIYTMHQQGLDHTAKHRKSATVVGDVMGKYHPHGNDAIYDALVRMAQSFSLRVPLIDGSGNFGSIDGDNAAAFRYTECRLAEPARHILADIRAQTVHFKSNYDGSRTEPVVLPARLPNLLINGATGIAVGMATNMPPHNPVEVCRALLKLLSDPDIKDYQLVANDAIQGPDFPTGGEIVVTKEELREMYRTGSGTFRIRGTTKLAGEVRGMKLLQIISIPYGVNKSALVERIGEAVQSGKIPLIQEIRDVSTEDIRVDLLLRKEADEAKVLAWLYKNTQLQVNFGANMTCLVPTENPAVGAPQRLGLKELLWHFLHFRLEVVTKRLENELEGLEKRLHILAGFLIVFDALDEIIRIIRKSEGKADAAQKIMARFPAGKGGLDAEQTDAILELKLYRLARLEINLIREEQEEKEKRARAIRRLLKEDATDNYDSGRWKIVREEIEEILELFEKGPRGSDAKSQGSDANSRSLRSKLGSDPLSRDLGSDPLLAARPLGRRLTAITTAEDEPEFTAEDFIVDEDCAILLTADGWVKRQKQVTDLSKTRLREGDSVRACVAGSTRGTVAFFSSLGVCYTARMIDVPASSGYGEPVQKLFKLKDGERLVTVLSLDPRVIGNIAENPKKPNLCPETHGFAASSNGYALRFGLAPFAEPSTRSGRRYARVAPGSEIINVFPVSGSENILAISHECRAMVCPAGEVNYLSGPGKGVMLIKLSKSDRLVGFKPSTGDRDLLVVMTNRGAKKTISTAKYRITSRGGKGIEVQKNGSIAQVVLPPPDAPETPEEDD